MVGRASCAVGLALALLLSSCNLPGMPTPPASASPANTSRVSHLQVSEAEDAQTLDPALINDPTSLAVGAELFQGLTRLDATLRPVPSLAQSWEIADSGRVYTFHLRAAKYQSGATVKAQDALTAWMRALAPQTASPLTTFFAPLGARYPGDALTGVQAVDQKTLLVRLSQPDSSLLTRLALPPYWLDDPSLNGAVSSGSGPYHLDKWDRGHGLHLSTFSDYWEPRSQVRSIDIEIEPDSAKRLDRFTGGAVDIAHGFSGPQLLGFARDPQHLAQLHKVANTRTTYLGFNTIAGSGYGPPERLAIAQAIDRGRLTDLALFGSMLAAPASDLIPPGVAGHLDRHLTGFDPVSARAGLDQAGFPSQIGLYFSTNSTVGRVARDLQDQISSATGRTVNLHPTGDFFNRASLDQLPLIIDTWSADFPYASDVLDNLLASNAQFNNLRVGDPEIDAALGKARAALTWDDAIKEYQKAEEIALSDHRLIPLYSGVEPYLVRSGLKVPFSGGVIAYRWEDVR
ncbi:MAG: ABC transporter substrate-binding protein [Candidatus Dormibacteraeota bacterium]|nr:ABC transporter substrate-binding protein [Candidatus Dormibacteraeota bacterium]